MWVAEHYLLDGLNEFLNQHVFGAYRRSLLSTTLDERVTAERDEHAQRISAAEKALHDVDQRRRRLVRVLEVTDDPEPSLLRDVNRRGAELSARHDELTGQPRRLREQRLQLPNPNLIDALPVGACDVNEMPEPLARRLFEALRLEIHYDKDHHAARYRVTLAADTVHVAHQTAATAFARGSSTVRDREIAHHEEEGERFPSVMCPRRDSNLRSCPVPPAGLEPALVSGAPGGIGTCARVRCPRRDWNLRSCPVPPAGLEPALVSGAPGGIGTCARVRCTQLGIVRTQTCR